MVNVVIVAAGSGSRFGSDLPKQFHVVPSTGRRVIDMTIDAFRSALPDARIVVVVSEGMEGYVDARTDIEIVRGGRTRFHSVANAIDAIDIADGDTVLVHDGARPMVDAATIGRVVDALGRCKAVVPVVAVTDSLRCIGEDGQTRAVDRSLFRAVQTPQGFDALTLKHAYDHGYRPEFTDDASVIEAAGMAVSTVDGSPANIKITNRADLDFVSLLATK